MNLNDRATQGEWARECRMAWVRFCCARAIWEPGVEASAEFADRMLKEYIARFDSLASASTDEK